MVYIKGGGGKALKTISNGFQLLSHIVMRSKESPFDNSRHPSSFLSLS